MDEYEITIDVDSLKQDIIDDYMGAAFGGGFGGALVGAFDIERASAEEIVSWAVNHDIDLSEYVI